jgi:hypothetical protein
MGGETKGFSISIKKTIGISICHIEYMYSSQNLRQKFTNLVIDPEYSLPYVAGELVDSHYLRSCIDSYLAESFI